MESWDRDSREYGGLIPYRWGFGVDAHNPEKWIWASRFGFFRFWRNWTFDLVNLTAGSPYYNPHVQRPALYPPSDGYRHRKTRSSEWRGRWK